MSWLKPNLRSSLHGLLGSIVGTSDSRLESGMEDIRESMLSELGQAGLKQFPHITRRIRYAADVQGLWYLRGDLMAALAAMHGELAARQKVRNITSMFEGLLPNSLNSRPSPLVS